jgi:hypothetical protein
MTPEETLLLNLRDLTEVYRESTVASWGARLIDSAPPVLPISLRASRFDRLLGVVSPREAIATLLRFYGLLEVASLAALIPSELPQEFREAALRHLENLSIRLFYERDAPMLLPQIFRVRLERQQNLREERSESAGRLVQHLLGLYGSLSEDDDVAVFLAVARRGDDKGLSDLFNALESQDAFLGRVVNPRDARGDGKPVLHGFRKFVLHCIDMQRVFSEGREFQLLGMAVRWFHADWLFNDGDNLRRVLDQARLRVRNWRPSEGEEADRTRAAFDRLENAVVDVFSQPQLPFDWLRRLEYVPQGWGQTEHRGPGA